MRFLVLLVLVVASASMVSAGEPVHDCRLRNLLIGGGGVFSSPFDKDHYDYFCSCLYEQDHASMWAEGMEDGTTVSMLANNEPVTPFFHKTWSPSFWLNPGDNDIDIKVNCGDCEKHYHIKCHRRPPHIYGDPQFTGIRGQEYQVHGIDGQVYNIVSHPDVQVNSKFVFLNKGQCPVIDGQRQKACWSHPGQYLGEIGMMTQSGDRIEIVSGSATNGFASVTFNSQPLSVGETVTLSSGGRLSFNRTHTITVDMAPFLFEFENSDNFINTATTVTNWKTVQQAHGLLGQTWDKKTYNTPLKYIQGAVEDYHVIGPQPLFGTAFHYNRFTPSN